MKAANTRRVFQIALTVVLLFNFAPAQKSKKPLSAEDYYRRGLAKMKIAETKSYEDSQIGFETAIKDFDKAIELRPRDARFYLKRGECFDARFEMARAVADFSRAIELKPDFVEAYLARATALAVYVKDEEGVAKSSQIETKDSDAARQALADFNRAVEINPGNPDAYLARAKTYFLRLNPPDYENALKDINRAVELRPRSSRMFVERAAFYLQLEDYEKALRDADAAVRLNSRDAEAFRTRAEIYAGMEEHEKAIADFSAALKLRPDDSSALNGRATAYRAIGKIRLAEADEKKAEKLSPSITVPLESWRVPPTFKTEEELTDSYVESSKEEYKLVPVSEEGIRREAEDNIARLNNVLKANPQFAGAFFERGDNYLVLREYDKAIADYSEAIRLDSKDHMFFNNRGIAHARKGDYDSAIKDFTEALRLDAKQESAAAYNRALARGNKGDYEKAAEEFTNVLKGNRKHEEAYRLRARAYRKLGKIPEAEADEAAAKRLQQEALEEFERKNQ